MVCDVVDLAQKMEMMVRCFNKKQDDLLKNQVASDKVITTIWNVLEVGDRRT